MLFVIARPARARRRRRSRVPSNRRRPLVLLAGALLHAARRRRAVRVAAAGPRRARWLALRPAREGRRCSRRPRSSSPRPIYAQGYLARRARPRQPRVRAAGSCSCSAAMTAVALSHHLGLSWVAIEATTLATRAAHLLQPQRPLARGGLEVPPHLLARHRARAARHVLPRAVRRRARAARARSSSTTSSAAGPHAVAAVGARRVRLPPRRLRHEDGARPAAHLEARRLRRGARAPRRAPRRRRSRTSRSSRSSGCSRSTRAAGDERVRARRARRPRAALDGARRGVRGGPARLQADARVLERRAHGHPRPRRRARRRGRRRRVLPLHEQRAHEGRALPLGGQHPPRLRLARRRDDVRGAARRLPISGPLFLAGFLADHRLAAVLAVLQRVRDPERRVRRGAVRRRRRSSSRCSPSSSSAWRRPCSRVVQGDPGRRAARAELGRQLAHRRAAASRSCCSCSLLGLFLPQGLRELFGAAARARRRALGVTR